MLHEYLRKLSEKMLLNKKKETQVKFNAGWSADPAFEQLGSEFQGTMQCGNFFSKLIKLYSFFKK